MFAASRCYKEGKIGCTTCHNPHATLETKLAAYDAACANCHAKPKHKVAIAARNCVECHMPAVRPSEGLKFANHRIAIYPATSSPH